MYGRLPAIELVSLSDDGQKLAFMLTNGEERRIAVRNLVSGDTKVLDADRANVRRPQVAVLRLQREEPLLLAQQVHQRHGLEVERQFTRFDLGEVQHVHDQRDRSEQSQQQRSRRGSGWVMFGQGLAPSATFNVLGCHQWPVTAKVTWILIGSNPVDS